MPKLVKSTKTHKFPQKSTSVKTALRRAQQGALDHKFSKIIIIGYNNDDGWRCYATPMSMHDTLGMLEMAKSMQLEKDR